MNHDELIRTANSFFFETCIPILEGKGREYANSEEDRLANFKRVSQKIGITPMQVCNVYLSKHLDSIDSMVSCRTAEEDMAESFDGRIADAVNYLLLMLCLHRDGQIVKGLRDTGPRMRGGVLPELPEDYEEPVIEHA